MLVQLTAADWKVLRALARAGRKPGGVRGSLLRLDRARRTKDGSFLMVLVRAGLITVETRDGASPFDAWYKLTDLGRHAAEYGEYEVEWDTYKKTLAAGNGTNA